MTSDGRSSSPRPREVTVAGVQIVFGSAVVLALAFNGMAQLRSTQMRDVLVELLESEQAAQLDLTLESAQTLVRYSLLIAGGLAAVALVLGVFVLRRDRPSRLALTILGGLIALVTLAGGPPAWLLTAYVVVSVLMLWTKAARAWFAPEQPHLGAGGSVQPPRPPPPPPSPPRG